MNDHYQQAAFDELSNYQGEEDFGGTTNQDTYSLKVVNSNASPRSMYLNPSYKTKAQNKRGIMASGAAFNAIEEASGTSLTVTGDTFDTIEGLLEHWRNNPTLIGQIQVNASAVSGINSGSIRVEAASPYGQKAASVIKFSKFKDPRNLDDKTIMVKDMIQVNAVNDVILTVPGSCSLDLCMFIANVASQVRAIENAAPQTNRTLPRRN